MSYTVIAQGGGEPFESEAPSVRDALDLALQHGGDDVTIVSANGWRFTLDELEALAKA